MVWICRCRVEPLVLLEGRWDTTPELANHQSKPPIRLIPFPFFSTLPVSEFLPLGRFWCFSTHNLRKLLCYVLPPSQQPGTCSMRQPELADILQSLMWPWSHRLQATWKNTLCLMVRRSQGSEAAAILLALATKSDWRASNNSQSPQLDACWKTLRRVSLIIVSES